MKKNEVEDLKKSVVVCPVGEPELGDPSKVPSCILPALAGFLHVELRGVWTDFHAVIMLQHNRLQ